MESEDIVDSLACDPLLLEYLVIAGVQLLAPHNTDHPETTAVIHQFPESNLGDLSASKVQFFNKLELLGYHLDSFILYLAAAQQIQLPEEDHLSDLADSLVCDFAAFT